MKHRWEISTSELNEALVVSNTHWTIELKVRSIQARIKRIKMY